MSIIEGNPLRHAPFEVFQSACFFAAAFSGPRDALARGGSAGGQHGCDGVVSIMLRLYAGPRRLVARLPALCLLTWQRHELRALAARLCPAVQAALGRACGVELVNCESQIGCGALPTRTVSIAGLALHPGGTALAAAFRRLPVPVIGRLHDGRLIVDLRCLQNEPSFVAQLEQLAPPP